MDLTALTGQPFGVGAAAAERPELGRRQGPDDATVTPWRPFFLVRK